ncbi:MAG TPA: sensor histidine kinase [Kofleriaceae bacterium]|nr:sensor histidine kinase [Kofleriaceae bacterium]
MPALVELLRRRRDTIVERWVARMRDALAPRSLDRGDLINSLEEFLLRLGEAVVHELEGSADGVSHAARIAREHGRQRFELGYDLASTIREYGILRDVLFEVADEQGDHAPDPREVRAMARCFFEVVAECATRYATARDEAIMRQTEQHVAFLAHELRNAVSGANLAIGLLRENGSVDASSRVGGALIRSLGTMRELIDGALVTYQLRGGRSAVATRVELEPFLSALVRDAAIEGEAKRVGVELVVPPRLAIDIDGKLIGSAVSNLVRNAIKFSRIGGAVRVEAKEREDAVVIEVEDTCGGLPLGAVEKLFDPFIQAGTDRSGFGLGLAIAKQAVDAHGGALRVHDLPGKGCVFVMDLPKLARTPASRVD